MGYGLKEKPQHEEPEAAEKSKISVPSKTRIPHKTHKKAIIVLSANMLDMKNYYGYCSAAIIKFWEKHPDKVAAVYVAHEGILDKMEIKEDLNDYRKDENASSVKVNDEVGTAENFAIGDTKLGVDKVVYIGAGRLGYFPPKGANGIDRFLITPGSEIHLSKDPNKDNWEHTVYPGTLSKEWDGFREGSKQRVYTADNVEEIIRALQEILLRK